MKSANGTFFLKQKSKFQLRKMGENYNKQNSTADFISRQIVTKIDWFNWGEN